jgi:hypothetical protein
MRCLDGRQVCSGCGEPIDERAVVTRVPGATFEEEVYAEVIAYYRQAWADNEEEPEFADLRFWHGDCWRADEINMPSAL